MEARREPEMAQSRAVIAEITADNLELKRDLRLDDLSRVQAPSKAAVIRIVMQTKQRSRWPAHRTLAVLGVPRSVYYGWRRREFLEDRPDVPCRVYEVLPEEPAAICECALQYPKIGYRKLTWMMVDAAIACVGESTVHRVSSEADLLSRWKRSERSSGEYHFGPTAPTQQWHTDVMYVGVMARFYFLLSFVDAFSRYIVHHKVLLTLDGQAVAIELQAALEAHQGVAPRVVHDHGSEFVNRDVAPPIKAHDLIDIKTRPRNPESNGIVERFNGTVRDEADNDYGANYLQAEAIIGKLMPRYNEERLHATPGYMTPATCIAGNRNSFENRVQGESLRLGRIANRSINQQRLTRAAGAVKVSLFQPGRFVQVDVKRDNGPVCQCQRCGEDGPAVVFDSAFAVQRYPGSVVIHAD